MQLILIESSTPKLRMWAHGFIGKSNGPKIDYIMVKSDIQVTKLPFLNQIERAVTHQIIFR